MGTSNVCNYFSYHIHSFDDCLPDSGPTGSALFYRGIKGMDERLVVSRWLQCESIRTKQLPGK